MNNKGFAILAGVMLLMGGVIAQRAQQEVRLDGYRGAVKQVTQITYEAQGNGEAVLERGDVIERIETLYLQNGQRKSMSYLSSEEDVQFRSRYKHDGFGVTTLEHVVDNADNIVGRTYYVYNPDFYLTEFYTEDEDRQVESRTLIKYDNHHRVSQRTLADAQGNTYRREVYIYNESGNIMKTVVFDRAGNKMQEQRFEYDVHGQPVTQTVYDYSEAEPEMYITLFRYKYDSKYNWIQKTEYEMVDNSPVATTITERTIKYY